MKVTYDRQFGLMYVKLTDHPIHATKRVSDDVVLDYDADGNIVGIELLNASHIPDPAHF